MTKRFRILAWAAAVTAGLLVLAVVALWGIAMPIRNLPEPTGPHVVGTISLDLNDDSRVEAYSLSDDPGPRRFRAQIW
ncbi:MAG: hypothetical protein EA383_16190, partial [Spirochaetaceae bacterium]